ncbi:hypothetical protein [Paraburkholderia acidisoli]|uniref:Uncharacterized protein n=1 Tax=Paraburkholderia acidisoli TaxID=2571748 RepID=A0A7Z2GM04_9BURK|nr:hypothetical protein [Paraburkholderia acidisoli]QGZ64278.1 hypothetical protein FAZ98_21390 [Paraburkholderia acidisoli]
MRPTTAPKTKRGASASPPSMSSDDYGTLLEGLESLLRERLMAYRLAARLLAGESQPAIDVGQFGLTDIIRLKQLLEPYANGPVLTPID